MFIQTKLDAAPGVAVLRVSGRLDVEHHGDLRATLQEVKEKGYFQVVVELRRVEAVTSSSVGALVGFARDLEDEGGGLILAAVSEPCAEVFQLLRLSEYFTFADTEKAALRMFTEETSGAGS